MAWGLRVRNQTTGSLQIDQGYYNLALVSKHEVTSEATYAAGSTFVSRASLTLTGDAMPIIAVSSDYAATIISIDRSGNNWTFFFFVGGLSRPLTVFRFGQPLDLGPGWGIRCKTNGVVTWDSRQKYLRRVDRIAQGSGTHAVPSGRRYAVMMSNCGFRDRMEWLRPSPSVWQVSQLKWFDASAANYSNYAAGPMQYFNALYETSQNPGAAYDYNSLGSPVSIIDVTGF